MYTKVLATLALVTIVNGNDVIVGLKTDGRKFFDENRQANPALWRQMDNVTIKAPENEVIRRIVITDLRPDKDGDVKVVEGGEGQKNVTIELKSPTVLRGYEFHIEVYSTPDENVPLTNEQQSTTEIIQTDSTSTISTNPTTNLDLTTKLPELSTDKIVPAILSEDEVKDNERQGRNSKNEDNVTSEDTTELTSTTLKNDVSTTQHTENTSESDVEKSSDAPNKFEHISTISPIPLNRNFNINPVILAASGKDFANDQFNVSGNDETRHVRETEQEKSGTLTQAKVNVNPTNVGFESSTQKDTEVTSTQISDAIPVEEKSEDKEEDEGATAPESHSFNNPKYTTIIESKVDHPHNPIEAKDANKLRNARGADEEQKNDENLSTTPGGTTTDMSGDTTTLSNDDCVTTEATNIQNPVNIGRDTNEGRTDPIPMYVNNRQWNQRFNNPTFQRDGQSSTDFNGNPAVLINDQSTLAPDAERFGNEHEASPDHMEHKNSKLSAMGSH